MVAAIHRLQSRSFLLHQTLLDCERRCSDDDGKGTAYVQLAWSLVKEESRRTFCILRIMEDLRPPLLHC